MSDDIRSWSSAAGETPGPSTGHSSAERDEPAPHVDPPAVSRRKFLRGAGEVAAGGILAQGLIGCATVAPRSAPPAPLPPPGPAQAPDLTGDVETLSGDIDVELDVNGAKQTVRVEPRTTLLDALRVHCNPPLTGTKLVCDRGNCGACTVIVDGRPRYACLQLAADVRGKKVRTIEGLAHGDELTPLQDEFCKHDASMCGFCTPGFVMAISAALEKNPRASLAQIKEACAGNLCRCGTYPHIFDAALAAAQRLSKG